MKMHDYVASKSLLPPDNWRKWLKDEKYRFIAKREILGFGFELFTNSKVYAMYHPKIHYDDTECLYINLPNLEQANQLLNTSVQMIGLLTEVGQGLPDNANAVLVTEENLDAVVENIVDQLFPPDETN